MLPLMNSLTKCTDSAEACDFAVPCLSDVDKELFLLGILDSLSVVEGAVGGTFSIVEEGGNVFVSLSVSVASVELDCCDDVS